MLVNDPDEVIIQTNEDDDDDDADDADTNPATGTSNTDHSTNEKRSGSLPQVPSYFKRFGSAAASDEVNDESGEQAQRGTCVSIHQSAFNCSTSRFVRLGADALEVELASSNEEAEANVALMSLFSLTCGIPAYDLSVAWCEGTDRVLVNAQGVGPGQLLHVVQRAMAAQKKP
jgi:hypothetical protein